MASALLTTMADPLGPDPAGSTPRARGEHSVVVLKALQTAEVVLAAGWLAQVACSRLNLPAVWSSGTLEGALWPLELALGVSLVEGFLWAWWSTRMHDDLRAVRPDGEDDGPAWLWFTSFFPGLSLFARLLAVARLVHRADPSRLPPAVEERERPAGFRDDPVTRRASPPGPSRLRGWLWWALWAASSAPAVFVWVDSRWFEALPALFLVSALSARQLVSGVTASVGELTRRHRHQRASGAGQPPAAVLRSMTMRSVRWLLPVAAVACSLLTPAVAPAQSRPLLIPGLPVPVMMPAGALAGGVPAGVPGGVPGATVPGAVPPGQSGIGVVPPGSVDGNGYLTQAFMRAEAEQMLGELVGALAPANKAKVQGIPFAFDAQTTEFNAYAGCENGAPFMAMTLPLLRAVGHIAEAKASDEVFGSRRTDVYTRQAAEAMNASAPVPDPAPGFYSPQEALDPRKLGRQRIIFDEMVGFVLGHELAHHYLGHTGCANGSGGGGIDPGILLRLPSRAIPVFNQPIEAAADTNGTNNVLDLGASRQGGLSEQGAVLTLQFFGALQQLSPSSLLLGVLRTHPQPQLRIPLVQQTAQQWRTRRASGQVGPTNSSPFPFPIPIPFLTK